MGVADGDTVAAELLGRYERQHFSHRVSKAAPIEFKQFILHWPHISPTRRLALRPCGDALRRCWHPFVGGSQSEPLCSRVCFMLRVQKRYMSFTYNAPCLQAVTPGLITHGTCAAASVVAMLLLGVLLAGVFFVAAALRLVLDTRKAAPSRATRRRRCRRAQRMRMRAAKQQSPRARRRACRHAKSTKKRRERAALREQRRSPDGKLQIALASLCMPPWPRRPAPSPYPRCPSLLEMQPRARS